MGALRDLRKALGWSQARMGSELGLAQNSISNYERGAYPIPSPVVKEIWRRWKRRLRALGLELEDLV
jgi:transcriptional regulator with XRE-family HTH domain